MEQFRKIKRIVTGKRAVDGAGVHLVRVFGGADTADFDPFLMLDAFDSTDPADYTAGFPWHPHRGIETVTYLIEGEIEHGDSLGNQGSIMGGECQWMTAGSGIIHQEMPKASPRMLGAQLWLNLPAQDKMTKPAYHLLTGRDIPAVQESGAVVRVLAGSYGGQSGAMQGDFVQPLYLDVTLPPQTEWMLDTVPEHTVFLYLVQGAAQFPADGRTTVAEKHVVLLGAGERLQLKSTEQGVRFLLLAGQPLGEPIAWGGPIVMNTAEQLQQAFRELEQDTFIKK